MNLSLENLEKAAASLRRACARPKDEYIRDAVNLRFEYTYELAWKALRKQLILEIGISEVDGISRRELFRKCLGQRLVSDLSSWTGFHDARNNTSHNYDEREAERVYLIALAFLAAAEELVQELGRRGWTHAAH